MGERIPPAGSALEAEALRFIRDLIRIESVNTGDLETVGDGEARAARYVRDALEEVGYETTYLESHPGRGNVFARLRGADPARGALVVHAHLDVVPVDGQDWTHPPFGAEIDEGLLYGRGAVDMKNFAGVILAVAASRSVVVRFCRRSRSSARSARLRWAAVSVSMGQS